MSQQQTPSIPTGYDVNGLQPKILVYDIDDALQYAYESDILSANPKQDFQLELWSLHKGVNTDHGDLVLLIDDPQKNLLDLTDARRNSKLGGMWKVLFYLGKNSSKINLWFTGYIQSIQPVFENSTTTKHRIYISGEGIRTVDRKTTMKFFQKKNADGLTLDSSDDAAKLSEIFKRLITNTDHLPSPISSFGFNIDDVQDIDIKIPDFQKNFESVGAALNELAVIASAYYGFENGRAYLRLRNSEDSGFLVTNMSWNNVIKDRWDQDKVCYMTSAPRSWNDSFLDYGYSLFNGIGAQKSFLDKSQTEADALLDLSSRHHAFPFVPSRDNLMKIAAYMSKTGTLQGDLIFSIIGANSDGTPNMQDARISKTINGKALNSDLTSATFYEIATNKINVSKNEKLFMVFSKYGDTANYPSVDYKLGSGQYYDSTDGMTWTAETGDVKFRSYVSKTVNIIMENTESAKKYGYRTKNIQMNNFKSAEMAQIALSAISESMGNAKRTYPQITVAAPTLPVQLGKTLRLVDITSGLEISPNVIAIDMNSSAHDSQSNLGATRAILTIEEWL